MPPRTAKPKQVSSDVEDLIAQHMCEIIYSFNLNSSNSIKAYRDILLNFHEKMKELENAHSLKPNT